MGGDNNPHGRPRVKKWIRAAFNFIALIPFVLELNSKGLYKT